MKAFFTLFTCMIFFGSHCWSNDFHSDVPEGRSTIFLQVTAVIEGAYTPDEEYFMHTLLWENGLLPNSQPYDPELPYFGNNNPVWYYTGSESVNVFPYPGFVVDWVLVELRDAPSAAMAHAGTVVARKAGLLLKSGMIIDVGSLPMIISVDYQHELYVVVYHRNHLSMMSSGPIIPLGGQYYSWDFTTGAGQAYGSGQKHLGSGVYGMYAGDADGNGQVQIQDKNNVWEQQSGQQGYLASDFNMDGQVQNQDKNNKWQPNVGIASQVPVTAVADGQPCPGLEVFTDPRDGNVYNTVYIGGKCWMKQNLKYLPAVYPPYNASFDLPLYYVYDYFENNVAEAKATADYQNYGVLYNWPAAVAACPAGWSLPDNNQWSQLTNHLINNYPDIVAENVANALKSCRQVNSPFGGNCATSIHPRWDYDPLEFGSDIFNFWALPAGYASYTPPVNFRNKGNHVYFWTSTEVLPEKAMYRWMSSSSGSVNGSGQTFGTDKDFGYSVRCLKSR
jgi:uncharacterized protein (TIGR02145 family)